LTIVIDYSQVYTVSTLLVKRGDGIPVNNEKISNRKAKAIQTKRRIYETADQLFRKYGFENVSVDSIVEKAGVSKGTFYVYFDSKNSLAAALLNDFVNEVDLDYKSYVESFDTKTAASDILISLIGKIADTLNYSIGLSNMKTLYKVQITKTINADIVMDYDRELYKIFSDIISRGVQRGEFITDIPVDILTKHCVLAIRGLSYEWCIRQPDFDLKEKALKHFEILLSGIKKR
jgi:AcrR family transcriptional regulator